MSFHVGQQVVCVSDRFSHSEYWRCAVRTLPRLNGIYTIREIREGYGDQRGLIGFCFYEFTNPRAQFERGDVEPGFISKHFRPMRKTSIELFEKLLVPAGASRKERRAKTVVPAQVRLSV